MSSKAKGLLLLFFIAFQVGFAQQKRPLNHSDYDGWERISDEKISKDGKWVGFQVSPQDGDGRVEIFSYKNPGNRTVIARGSSFGFSPSNSFAVGKIVPEKDSVYVLKLKKTKKEDFPADSLFIYALQSGNLVKVPRVKSFAIPENEGDWLAILYEKEKDEADSTKKSDKPKKTEGTKLEVRSLDGAASYGFERVISYSFSPKGEYLEYVVAEEDTLDNAAIYLLNLANGESSLISEGMSSYTKATFSPEAKYLAFLATNDSAKSEKPYHSLYLTSTEDADTKKVATKTSGGIHENHRVSADGNLRFSEDERRLFFGVTKDYVDFDYESDTTLLEEDRVSLDIWGWQDDEIQPMQLKNRDDEKKSSFLATLDLSSGQIVQLGDSELENIALPSKIEREYAIATTDDPYRRSYSWNIQIGRDIYLVDFRDGKRTLIEKNASGYPSLSPGGKYVYWYASRDSSWVAYAIAEQKKIHLAKEIPVPFYEELHDSPSFPRDYGSAGWLKEDAAFLVYDRFDIWKIDPKNPSQAVNLTNGEGRKTATVFRYKDLEREEDSIESSGQLLLTAFNEKTKNAGFFTGSYKEGESPRKLLMTPNRYFGFSKAEHSDAIILQRSSYRESPDLYLTDMKFNNLRKVSSLNPQQATVNWGSVELVDYITADGDPMQGLLFKPEGFDPNKKYPMMVYFYERSSDGLHRYRAPAPSASTINIPYFVSNGYLVFVPDIKYKLGLPGPSAYNCIIPGVQSIVAKGFVDADNMAIQGQSWGGYQVAYLITQTDMFKAAGAGAPVVNMTSAYGGIRWGTGMSRMFQYEQTQSRIGGTLWQKPLYYIENSPLFFMDRVKTPVLIMHNDEDGAVPWYQGIEMFMALKRLDKPAWLLQYNGEDHNLKQRKNRKDLSVRLSQFFDHYLKGAPAPLWMTEGLPAVEKGRTLKYGLED